MNGWFRTYLVPGLVFQSICVAGGYGTGRELAEFFLKYGPLGGLFGLLPATLMISIVSIVAFELARMMKAYDYRTFLKLILGRAWFLYEITYLISVVLILAVVGAATGTLLTEAFAIPDIVGTIFLLAVIAFLAFKGTNVIEGVLSFWSFVLYGVYATLFVLSFVKFGPLIKDSLATREVVDGWLLSGLRYASLQCSMIPAVLFAAAHITERRQAVIAGAITGPIYLLPATMFYFAMLGHYPEIIERPVPVNYVLQLLDSRALQLLFPIMLIGTFVETGTGMIHAFNERAAAGLKALGKTMPDLYRPVIALVVIFLALAMSRIGLIDLIAFGYGTMAWVFVVILIVPLLTVGVWRIVR